MRIRTFALGLIGMIAALAPTAMNADARGRHPAYLRARTDLRTAQFLMRVREEPNVTRNLERAAQETEAAIHEIDHAAVLDRKDMMDRPPVDTHLDRRHRMENILRLLRSARADLAREEDNGQARGWRDDAFRHIDAALEHVHRAAVDLHWDHELGF